MEASGHPVQDLNANSVQSRRSGTINSLGSLQNSLSSARTHTTSRSSTHNPFKQLVYLALLASIVFFGYTYFTEPRFVHRMTSQMSKALFRTTQAGVKAKKDAVFVIVGGGLAGMTATLTLLDEAQKALMSNPDSFPRRLKAVLVDKQPNLGGNSAKASSGINGVGSISQRRWEMESQIVEPDAIEYFRADTLRSCVSSDEGVAGAAPHHIQDEGHSGGKASNEAKHAHSEAKMNPNSRMKELVDALVVDSAEAIRFLETTGGLGTEPGLSRIVQLGGHSKPRTHRTGKNHPLEKMPIGVALTSTLAKRLKELEAKFKQTSESGEGENEQQRISLEIRTGFALTDIKTTDSSDTSSQTNVLKKVSGVVLSSKACESGSACKQGEGEGQDSIEVDCDGLLISTGGFGANSNLVANYAPALAHLNLPTTNGDWTTGEAVQIVAKQCNAALIDMQEVQVHPTSFLNPASPQDRTRFLAPEALRGSGGLLLNDSGDRFVNELATRDYVSRHIQSLLSPAFERKSEGETKDDTDYPASAFMLLTQEAAVAFGLPALNFYKFKGFVSVITVGDILKQGSDNIEGSITLAIATAMNEMRQRGGAKLASSETELSSIAKNIERTLEAYISSAKKSELGSADAFGKTVFPYALSFANLLSLSSSEDPSQPLAYLMLVAPAVHYTMGGVAIDAKGRALGWNKSRVDTLADVVPSISSFDTSEQLSSLSVIPGLFAAGEASGGLHGKNRLGGNSLLECVVFGRRAAKSMLETIL